MAPALRALLAGAAGHLLSHGGPAVAVLRLGGRARYRESPRSCRIAKSRASDRRGERASGGGGWAYLEAGEDDVLGVCPWRALEVNGVGHEGCLGC